MFDHIACEYLLPETGYEVPEGHDVWQTKSLKNLMDHYTIAAGGKLIVWCRDEAEAVRGGSEGVQKL